jgi:hypothetical protein
MAILSRGVPRIPAVVATRPSWRAIAAVEEQHAALPLPPNRPSPLHTDRCAVSILQREGVWYLRAERAPICKAPVPHVHEQNQAYADVTLPRTSRQTESCVAVRDASRSSSRRLVRHRTRCGSRIRPLCSLGGYCKRRIARSAPFQPGAGVESLGDRGSDVPDRGTEHIVGIIRPLEIEQARIIGSEGQRDALLLPHVQ